MPVTQHSSLKPGSLVSIVLKADQRTGREVQGTVSQLLTRHNHPRGIKVKLTDGRVGRVQQILNQTAQQPRRNYNMAQNNPWASEQSQGNPFQANNQQQGFQPPQGPPPRQQQGGSAAGYYTSHPQHSSQQYQQNHPTPPQSGRRSDGDSDAFLAAQPDRGEQFERMQQFEAHAPQSEDDKNQAQLQKEYPNIDSSLIAAIYNERKPDMGEVRELLQELNQN